MLHRIAFPALVILGITACTYDEGLVIRDMRGKIYIPEEAATRTIERPDGTTETVTDIRLIGPVYLGFFPSVREGLYEYPHPEIGPVFQQGIPGDTYPYGGTTVGDIRFACFEFLSCKMVSGRFVDYDAIIEWFNDTLQQPVPDAFGNPIETGEFIRQTCFEYMQYTSDDELRIVAYEDMNEDGSIDELDLDFVYDADAGAFVGEFTVYQQEYFDGFSLWGWMDAPSDTQYRFSTCDADQGFQQTLYNQDFFGGRQFREVLNRPSQFIGQGDWVGSIENGVHVYESPEDSVELWLDFGVK